MKRKQTKRQAELAHMRAVDSYSEHAVLLRDMAVQTSDGKTYFAANDALMHLYLSEAGNPVVVAVRMPSGVWSANPAVVRFFN